MLASPFVVKLVDYQYTIFIAELDKVAAIRVVRCADVVHSELLHKLYALLDSAWVGSCTKSTKGMVIGIALKQYLLSVKLKAELRSVLYGADSKLLGSLISHAAIFSNKLGYSLI